MKIDRRAIPIMLILVIVAWMVLRWLRRRKKIGNLMVINITNELPRGKGSYQKRKLTDITQVIIHHSATADGSPQAFARYHIRERGWPGIGYHFVIAKSGEIDQVNELETVSYHTSNENTRSVGICLTGNYDTQRPPAEQLDACVKLVRALSEQLGRRLDVHGHREFSTKSCPGKNINVASLASEAYKQA